MTRKTCNFHATVKAIAVFYAFSMCIFIPTAAVLANESTNNSTNGNYTGETIDVPQDFIPAKESIEFSSKHTIDQNDTTLLVAKTTVNDTTSDGDDNDDNVAKASASDPSPLDRKCTQRDTAGLNKCLQQVFKDLKPRLAAGIPEINIPPMEPLKLNNLAFDQGGGGVKVVSSFKDVEVSGLSNFSQSDFWVDVPKRTMDFDIVFPQLSISGVYELSGNLFFIPIGGNGNFYLNLGGTRAKGVSQLSVFQNSTLAQVVVKNTDVNLEIETIKVHLTNLFNGDPLLGTFINTFLNENSQEVFSEVKPQIGAQLGEMLSLLANQALSALSTSQFVQVPFSPSPDDVVDDDNNQGEALSKY